MSTFVIPFYYAFGTVINYGGSGRSVIKLRFGYRLGKKLRFLRFRFRNTEKMHVLKIKNKIYVNSLPEQLAKARAQLPQL